MIYLVRVRERWVYVDIMENVCRDIGQQTCQDGLRAFAASGSSLLVLNSMLLIVTCWSFSIHRA